MPAGAGTRHGSLSAAVREWTRSPARPLRDLLRVRAGVASVPRVEHHGVQEDLALSLAVEAGDFVYCSFCVGNLGQGVAAQVHGALDDLARRLERLGLGLADVVQVDALFRDIWDIPVLEQVFRERFAGVYPARKSIQTEFAHVGGAEGLKFQLDAVAYRGR